MDELEISGKRYISTRRAGRENGYHSDYIGQLIRGKKVQGQKVGRSWYVDQVSLATYLGKPSAVVDASVGDAVQHSPAQPEPTPIAAPTVVEAPVAATQEEAQEDIQEEVAPEPVKPEPVVVAVEEPVEVSVAPQPVAVVVAPQPAMAQVQTVEAEHTVAIRKPEVTAVRTMQHDSVEPVATTLRYVADEEPLLPEIHTTDKISRDAEEAPLLAKDEMRIASSKSFAPKFGLVAAALIAVGLGASAAAYVSTNISVEGETASISYSISH